MSHIALAKIEKGTVVCGGEIGEVGGKFEKDYFVKPTIIEGLPNSSRTNQEDIFRPVVTIVPFETEAEVIDRVNASNFGLCATLWTSQVNRAHRIAEKLECGQVWINTWLMRDLRTPYGGMKQSGIGRKGEIEALRFFTEAKNICVKY